MCFYFGVASVTALITFPIPWPSPCSNGRRGEKSALGKIVTKKKKHTQSYNWLSFHRFVAKKFNSAYIYFLPKPVRAKGIGKSIDFSLHRSVWTRGLDSFRAHRSVGRGGGRLGQCGRINLLIDFSFSFLRRGRNKFLIIIFAQDNTILGRLTRLKFRSSACFAGDVGFCMECGHCFSRQVSNYLQKKKQTIIVKTPQLHLRRVSRLLLSLSLLFE